MRIGNNAHHKVNLEPVHNKLKKQEEVLNSHQDEIEAGMRAARFVGNELEMQRRALVAIKHQRDIDRSRRLMLIQRMKKEQKAHKQSQKKMQLAVGASLLLSVISLLIKL